MIELFLSLPLWLQIPAGFVVYSTGIWVAYYLHDVWRSPPEPPTKLSEYLEVNEEPDRAKYPYLHKGWVNMQKEHKQAVLNYMHLRGAMAYAWPITLVGVALYVVATFILVLIWIPSATYEWISTPTTPTHES